MIASLILGTALMTPTDDTIHTKERAFRIPLDITDAERQSIAWVRLMVSTDRGVTWTRVREERPNRPTVTFRAPSDGLYWLALAVIGHDERMRPADPKDLKPGLKVFVDSTKPDVSLEAVKTRSGLRGIRWTIQDASPVEALQLHFAVWDDVSQVWKPRGHAQVKNNTLWFSRDERISKMQVLAVDPAGNESVTQVDIDGDRFICHDEPVFVFAQRAPSPDQVARTTPTKREPNVTVANFQDKELTHKNDAQPEQKSRNQELLPTSLHTDKSADVRSHDSPPDRRKLVNNPAKSTPKADAEDSDVRERTTSKPDRTRRDDDRRNNDPPPESRKRTQPAKAQETELPDENVEEPKRTSPTKRSTQHSAVPEDESTAESPDHQPAPRQPKQTKRSVTNKPRQHPSFSEDVPDTADNPKAETSQKEDNVPQEASFSNRRSVVLHYEMEMEDDAQAVTFWGTLDQGKTWRLIGVDEDLESPLQARFPKDGRWGVRLAIANDTHDGKPAPGTKPVSYVEVDTQKPTIRFSPPKYERDWIRLTWNAEDRNLNENTVRVSYSYNPDGPWRTIVTQQEANSEYVWKPSQEESSIPLYFRVDATDNAGNVGVAYSAEPIVKGAVKPAKLKTKQEPQPEKPQPAEPSRPTKPAESAKPKSHAVPIVLPDEKSETTGEAPSVDSPVLPKDHK